MTTPTPNLLRRGLVALALLAGCGGAADAPKAPTAVRVRAVERRDAAAAARYSAVIKPASRVDVAFRVGGYVAEIARVRGLDGRWRLLQEGDHVTRGTELAAVRRADYKQKLAEAQAALAEATAARQQAELDFDRASRLSDTQSIAKAELDTARARVEAARARAAGARARVEEAETALDDSAVRAPMDGVVLRRNVELGALAAPGTVAFAIADTGSVKVDFGVPDTALDTLRLGQPQAVTTEAYRGQTFTGRITRIAPGADPKSHVFEVEVTIPNPTGALKSGMVAALALAAPGREAPVAVLPLNAIVRAPGHPGQFAVYVLDERATPARVHVRAVELGEFLGNLIPIESGLREGEKVVVMGASLLSDGEAVQVIP